ncbi:DnaJ-domain-containing protein [Flagelloscypha sp. PMI_526]|nr:DnaJ-domain-containing protein [Flagelloscypha sp. PMI_526]
MCSQCTRQMEFPLPTPQPPPRTMLQIQCYSCSTIFTHAFYPSQIPSTSGSNYATSAGASSSSAGNNKSNSSASLPKSKGRKIGTQERPLETGYYDLLGVPVTATTDEVKKAYRRLAIKHHPDKNPDDPHAEERFKEIAIAYQTLSDPALRKKYNEFGSKETENESFVDPEAVFSSLFGGERFNPIIGEISLARDMKEALQATEDDDDDNSNKILDAKGRPVLSEDERRRKEEKKRKAQEERAAAREVRVKQLVENLSRKVAIFAESATGVDDRDVTQSFRTICELEAEELKRESYGYDLLQAIGFVYASKAKQFLATNQSFMGVGGWLHNVQGKYHVFSETVSTLRSAIELKGSVLRDTCDRVLEDPTVPREKAQLRAVALQIIGEAFMATKKEGSGLGDDSEYVRVETKNSRSRGSTGGFPR